MNIEQFHFRNCFKNRVCDVVKLLFTFLFFICINTNAQEGAGGSEYAEKLTTPYLYPIPRVTHQNPPIFRWSKVADTSVHDYMIKVEERQLLANDSIGYVTLFANIIQADTFFVWPNKPNNIKSVTGKYYRWTILPGSQPLSDTIYDEFRIKDPQAPILIETQRIFPRRAELFLKWRKPSSPQVTGQKIEYKIHLKDSSFGIVLCDTFTTDTSIIIKNLRVKNYLGIMKYNVTYLVNLDFSSDTGTLFRCENSIPVIFSKDEPVVSKKQKSLQPRLHWYSVPGDTIFYWVHLSKSRKFETKYKFPTRDTFLTITSPLTPGWWYWKISTSARPPVFSSGYDSMYVDSRVVTSIKNIQGFRGNSQCVRFVTTRHTLSIIPTEKNRYITQLNVFDCAGRTILSQYVRRQIIQWNYTNSIGHALSRGVFIIQVKLDDNSTTELKLSH